MRIGEREFRLEETPLTTTELIGMSLMMEKIQRLVTRDLDEIGELGIVKMMV